ncbi:hypothetical protein FB45DRAFT_1007127 [Roridomyces roridus]|uniref:Uncharacterized protein n=1 Tax=Roridomyces roridus TaxID=1738132 RepID=A0AAD7BFA7_9AGAR|nr:hypothetical protein FB45DRAFT_1007127 [Roridomyces roridus]
MCHRDILVKGFACGATSGRLWVQGTATPAVAFSTQGRIVECPFKEQMLLEYGTYRDMVMSAVELARIQQLHNPQIRIDQPQLPLRYEDWVVRAKNEQPCRRRSYSGVQKYGRHCQMDWRGAAGNCPQAGFAHVYRNAPGNHNDPIPLNDPEHPLRR